MGMNARSWQLMLTVELDGHSKEKLEPGKSRPQIDHEKFGQLDGKAKWGMLQDGFWWPECFQAYKAIGQSMLFPNILFISIINSAFVAVVLAAGLTGAPVLLAHG